MSTVPASSSKKRGLFRYWFPGLVIGLAVLAFAALWLWPYGDWGPLYRQAYTWYLAQITLGLLLFWLVFFSGVRWWLRLTGALALLVADVAAIREVKFTGDVMPIMHYRWEPTPADALEAHRRSNSVVIRRAREKLTGDAPLDFPEYRGRRRDGIVTGPPLARDWKSNPPRLLWKQPVGGGYAAFAIAGNRAITIEQRRAQEVVACYDTATGTELWTHAYDAFFTEPLGGEGPRATPTISDGEVFSLGATGTLVCLDAATGKLKWGVDILAYNQNITWAMSGSPLVTGKLVIVNPGVQQASAQDRALLALDRATGKVVWQSGTTKAGYSSPMLATLAGAEQVLLLDSSILAGYDPATGKELWRFDWPVYQDINVAQPLVLDNDRVFISSSYGVGCAMLQIKQADRKWSVETLWRNKAMSCKFTSPVAYRGHLYGLDEGILVCVEEKTGKRMWKDGRYGHGQLLLAEDLLVILSETGKLVLVEATPEAHRELGRINVFKDRTWNPLALAGGIAYVRSHREMAAFDLSLPAGK